MKYDIFTPQISIEASRVRLHTSRDRARDEVMRAWAKLEGVVVEALAGDAMRGLPNLGTDKKVLYGIRVKEPARMPFWLNESEGWVLVILRTGRIAMARFRRGLGVEWRQPEKDELRIEDFEAYVRTLSEVLMRNAERVEKTAKNYDATARLAKRIADVVGF